MRHLAFFRVFHAFFCSLKNLVVLVEPSKNMSNYRLGKPILTVMMFKTPSSNVQNVFFLYVQHKISMVAFRSTYDQNSLQRQCVSSFAIKKKKKWGSESQMDRQ